MNIGQICNRKIPTVPGATTVLAAARSMEAFDEHCLVVTDERQGTRVASGIVTDREIAAVLAREGDPARLVLEEIMRPPPGFLAESDDVLDALAWMRRHGLNEAVVHDSAGRLLGLIGTDLMVECLAAELADGPAATPASDARGRNAMN